MENDKETNVDRLNGDAAEEVNEVVSQNVDTDNTNDAGESTSELSKETKAEVEVSIYTCCLHKII